jgi:hypothetical protein
MKTITERVAALLHSTSLSPDDYRAVIDEISLLQARITAFEQAVWKVIAYDQLLRSISSADILFAGDAPDVDAAYDDMIRTVIDTMASRVPISQEASSV